MYRIIHVPQRPGILEWCQENGITYIVLCWVACVRSNTVNPLDIRFDIPDDSPEATMWALRWS